MGMGRADLLDAVRLVSWWMSITDSSEACRCLASFSLLVIQPPPARVAGCQSYWREKLQGRSPPGATAPPL